MSSEGTWMTLRNHLFLTAVDVIYSLSSSKVLWFKSKKKYVSGDVIRFSPTFHVLYVFSV